MTLARLKLLAGLGWGCHPDALRVRSITLLRMFRGLILLSLVVFPAPVLLLLSWHRRRLQWPPSPAGVRFGAIFVGLYAALFAVCLLVPGITSWWLARRGARGDMATIYGRCFAVLIDPPGSFFARIGLTPETARWYSLPLDWDGVVAPSDVQLELTVLEGTGWVERLRRLGTVPRELSQPVPQLSMPVEEAAPSALDAEGAAGVAEKPLADDMDEGATKEEKEALRRFARQANLGWRSSPRDLAYGGWALVAFGALLILLPLGLIAYLAFESPQMWAQSLKNPGVPEAMITSVAICAALGLAFLIAGLCYVCVWRRYRRSSQEPPASVEGEVLAWMPYRDVYTPPDGQQRRETLISLRTPDGQSRIFRIPIRFLHRVRQRGAQVRITFLPTTERVLDVLRMDVPVAASVGDASAR